MALHQKKVNRVFLFADGTALKFVQNEFGISIQVPNVRIDETDTIIFLEL